MSMVQKQLSLELITEKAEREAAKDRSMLLDAKGDDVNHSHERIVEIRKKS